MRDVRIQQIAKVLSRSLAETFVKRRFTLTESPVALLFQRSLRIVTYNLII